MPDQFEKYYTYLKSNGADVAPDFNSFKNTLSNYDNASKYYTYLKDNKFDVPETYDLFADTFGLKKKIGGAISSLTELPSEFIEPLKKGVSPNQTKEEERLVKQLGIKPMTGVTVPTNLPKQDEMRYERELKTQDAAINTLTDIYKQKGLKFDPSKPAAQEQIQDYIEQERSNDLARVTGKDGKEYLTRGQGFIEAGAKALVNSVIEPFKSAEINFTNTPSELADLLDKKIAEEPNVPESAPTKVGGYMGGLLGGLPKLMGLLSIPYFGESAMVIEMYHNAIANERRTLYQRGIMSKENGGEGLDREAAAKMAMETAPITAAPDAAMGLVLARGVSGKNIIPDAEKKAFRDALAPFKDVAKVAGLGGVAGSSKSLLALASGYDVTATEVLESGGRSAGEYALMDGAFKLMHKAGTIANVGLRASKAVVSAAKNLLSSVPKEILEVQAEKYPDGKEIIQKVEEFAKVKDEVKDLVPAEKVGAVAGITQKIKNIQVDIDELTARREKTTDALKPQIDEWLKEYQDEIDFYNNQIKKVVKSKDPSGISEEIDDVTGEKIGVLKYNPTKEVKPTEAKTASLEEEYDSKNVDELIALKKKLYPSPDIESPMTPEEKLLDRVIAKKFSEKQQEIISKRKTAAEKAPTKELAEGEEVTFNTPEGKKLTGEKITIPGFEKIDMVMVKEGLNNTVYDLASGSELVEGDFSKEGAIESLINQFKEKNITQPKIYGLIYKSTNTSSFEMNKNRVPQINPSSMFESYSEKRKAFDKAEYEKIPLKYTPKEIEDLNKLKNKAIENGLDEVVFDINKRIEERGTENKVNYYDYFDRRINSEIEEKAKKEAEDKGVPYPKKYMKETSRITIDRLKKTINEGFKRDKFESIPEDVRKIMLDGYQKNIDILNKYGYYPDEKTKTFFDKLYQYVAAQTKRENRESQIAEAKKELISALDYLNKAHEKEFGKKAEAEVKPKEGEVKVYNAKDLKANPEVLKEDKDYYSLTYPKSFVKLSTNMRALKSSGFENAKIGDVINIFKKDYVIDGFLENKKNPNETKILMIRVDKDGNLLREQDLSKKEQKEGKAKEFEEEEEVEVEETEQVTKDDVKKAEAKFAAAEDRFKKARNKIEATQVKQAGMFGGEQKGMFAMGGEEAKSTLDPLRKAAKEAKAELDNVRNRIKVQEAAQPELKPIEKSGLTPKEIRQKESEIAKDYYKTFPIGKIKDGSIFTDTKDTYSTFKFEIERQGKQVASETVSQIKKWAESRGLEYTGTSKEDIRKTIDFKLPFKESPYQKAVKEKLEADKRQNRQIGSEKAAITKEIYRKVNQMDAPADAEQIALRYLADGGKVSKEAIDEAYGSVKRAQLNTGRRELLSEEVKSKDFVQGNETLDETAHRLWEENNQRVSEIDIKNSLMAEIGNNNTRLEAAEVYLDNYNEGYKQEKEEMRMAEQYKEEYLEEQEKLEKELREPLTEQIEGEASEEHINNLIDQYEAEIKGEDQQFGPESEGEVNKEASKGNVGEKVRRKAPEKSVEEAYKDLTINQKRQIINSKFDELLKELKIEKICPT